jgi:hypothetical protein
VLSYAAIARIFAIYVRVLRRAIRLITKNCAICVRKFVERVPKNAQNTPHITKVAKNVLLHVGNVQTFVLKMQVFRFS